MLNRRAFETRAEAMVSYAKRHGVKLGCLFIDIDKFKIINDTFGHGVGDKVLQYVADKIASVYFRKEDILARFGGDEFVVLLVANNVNIGKNSYTL